MSQYKESLSNQKGDMNMMSRLSSVVKRHPIITFFVLAYAISWGALPFEAVRFLPSGPLFAALIVIPITQGWAGLRGAWISHDPLAREVVLVRGGLGLAACGPRGLRSASMSRPVRASRRWPSAP